MNHPNRRPVRLSDLQPRRWTDVRPIMAVLIPVNVARNRVLRAVARLDHRLTELERRGPRP